MFYNVFMPTSILATKLYISPPRPKIVLRPRLIGQLNDVLNLKLTLISAPAGFGKTTLVSEWIAGCGRPVAWLSLDEGDNDPLRFISYLIAALQTIKEGIGEGLLAALQSPQPPQTEAILTALLNEISTVPDNFLLVLDDYHLIDSQPVDQSLAFLVEHLPPQMHLVIATREDPPLPLARLRARGQLTELRAADLRFTPSEAAEFLNRVMGLNLSDEDIAALETRTEGWIAGLQLAALSMQGHSRCHQLYQIFHRQSSFRAGLSDRRGPADSSQKVFKRSCCAHPSLIACAVLFVTPFYTTPLLPGRKLWSISNAQTCSSSHSISERRWYRYHHLFGRFATPAIGANLARGTHRTTTCAPASGMRPTAT